MGQGLHKREDVDVFWSGNHSDFREPLDKQRHELKLSELDNVVGTTVVKKAVNHSDSVFVGLKREDMYSLKKLTCIEKVDQLELGNSGVSVALGYWMYLRQSGLSRRNFTMREYAEYVIKDTEEYKCSAAELASAVLPEGDLELAMDDPDYAAEVGSIDAGYITYSDEVDAKGFWYAMFSLDKEPEIKGTRFFLNILSANNHTGCSVADSVKVLSQVPRMCIYVDRKANFLQRIRNMWEIMKADQLKVPCRFFFEGEFRYDRLILALALCVGRLAAESASIKTAAAENEDEKKEMLDDILEKYGSFEKFDDILNEKLEIGCKEALADGCGNYMFTDLGRPGVLKVVNEWGYTCLWDDELDIMTKFGDFLGRFLYSFFCDFLYPNIFCEGQRNAAHVKAVDWRSEETKKSWDDMRVKIKFENKFPSIIQDMRAQYIRKDSQLDPVDAAKDAFDYLSHTLKLEEAKEFSKNGGSMVDCVSKIVSSTDNISLVSMSKTASSLVTTTDEIDNKQELSPHTKQELAGTSALKTSSERKPRSALL